MKCQANCAGYQLGDWEKQVQVHSGNPGEFQLTANLIRSFHMTP